MECKISVQSKHQKEVVETSIAQSDLMPMTAIKFKVKVTARPDRVKKCKFHNPISDNNIINNNTNDDFYGKQITGIVKFLTLSRFGP